MNKYKGMSACHTPSHLEIELLTLSESQGDLQTLLFLKNVCQPLSLLKIELIALCESQGTLQIMIQ
jgi:hypothetical protein